MKIGILALQGAVAPHEEKLRALGAEPVRVRVPADLEGLGGIILPGGESSTMLHLLRLNSLWEPLADFLRKRPAWGVCAGAILLARDVTKPAQASFGAMDIAVERNGWGRQLDSFIAPLDPAPAWERPGVEGVFIRAPRITRLGPGVRELLRVRGEAVMVSEGKHLASTFHPELAEGTAVHSYFLERGEA